MTAIVSHDTQLLLAFAVGWATCWAQRTWRGYQMLKRSGITLSNYDAHKRRVRENEQRLADRKARRAMEPK